jgi:hypothetical protein
MALGLDPVRVLIADDVGIGKTVRDTLLDTRAAGRIVAGEPPVAAIRTERIHFG